MLNMATDQNSGTVPNIIDIQFGDLDKKTGNKKDDKRLLGNFHGEIQIKGRYDVNKFMENILKNEDKPLILCMQFRDPQRESNDSRYIYLQTSYKMCPPVQKKGTTSPEFEAKRDNTSNTSMVVIPPSSEKSPGDFNTSKKPKDRNIGNKKKEEPSKMTATKSTLCEQLQNLLFPYQKKQSTGQAKRFRTMPIKEDKDKTKPRGYERNIGDGKHVDPTKKQKFQKTKGLDRERKLQHNTTPIGREIGDIELDGRRFGAIFFSDPDDETGTVKRQQKGSDDQLNGKYGNRRWVLDKGAEDLDKDKWNIPNWIPADTLCRCTSYFPDGKCKCHEFLQKIGIRDIGPLYVPQSTPYPGIPIQFSGTGPQKPQAPSRKHGSRQEMQTFKDREDNTNKPPDSLHVVRESGDDQRRREENKAKSQITFKPSGDKLEEHMNRPSGDRKGGYKSTPMQGELKDNQKRQDDEKMARQNGGPRNAATQKENKDDQKKQIKEINRNFCKCGYIPDKSRCKCIRMEFDPGKGPPGTDMGSGGEGKAGTRYANNRVLPCVSQGTAMVDGKNYTAELIIRDEDETGSKTSSKFQRKEPVILSLSGKDDEKAKFGVGDNSQYQRNEQPAINNVRNFKQPSKEDEKGREVVIVPGKEPVVKIPGDGNYPEELGEKHFYCGCTGLWIEYYPKDRPAAKAQKKEPTEEQPPNLEEAPKPGSDIIPGFSFKLESCTAKLDKNNSTIDKDCLIREQEIQRFKQSGYKNQPLTLIMNDPYSTPLRIYEVSASEGKRFISTQ